MHSKVLCIILLVFWTLYSEIKLSIGFCILLFSFNSVLVRSIHAALYLCGVLLLSSFPGTGYVSNCLLISKWTFHLVSIFRNNVTLYILIYEFMVDTQELLWSILLTVELVGQRVYMFWAILDKACFQVIPAFVLMLLSQRNHSFLSESRFGGRWHVAQLVESQLHNQGLLNSGHGSENAES